MLALGVMQVTRRSRLENVMRNESRRLAPPGRYRSADAHHTQPELRRQSDVLPAVQLSLFCRRMHLGSCKSAERALSRMAFSLAPAQNEGSTEGLQQKKKNVQEKEG
jgi:hypothetical protein